MNVIVIMMDSFRRDHIGAYGATTVHTPSLDRFAERATRFNRFYPANFLTPQTRHDLLTGRFTYTYAGWEPLARDEPTLCDALTAAGYASMLIADTPHPYTPEMNYQRSFTAWDVIRGQENDAHWFHDGDIDWPCDRSKIRKPDEWFRQSIMNASRWRGEEDVFVAQTMRRAAEWLACNSRRGKFFLMVDTFDPHEPWLAPQAYVDLYDAEYTGQRVIYPRYGKADYLTARETRHMRAQYAAEATMTDHWVGHLLGAVESLALYESTAVFILSDHGFLLGEHGLTGKLVIEDDDSRRWFPLYESLIATPLLAWVPGVERRPKTTSALCSMPDLTATILELTGVDRDVGVQGESFRPVLEGSKRKHRDFAVTAVALPEEEKMPGQLGTAVLNDGRFTWHYGGTDARDALYDLRNDPDQKRNLIRQDKPRAANMREQYLNWLEELGTDESLVALRRR